MAELSVEEVKSNSPGVPPNSCPYIDMVITCVKDITQAYEDLEERGIKTPMVHCTSELANGLLEHLRHMNETLRDNSKYWYDEYKESTRKSGKKT